MPAKFVVDWESLDRQLSKDLEEGLLKHPKYCSAYEKTNAGTIRKINQILYSLRALSAVLMLKHDSQTYHLVKKLDFDNLSFSYQTLRSFKDLPHFLSYLSKFKKALEVYISEFDLIPAKSGVLDTLEGAKKLLNQVNNLPDLLQALPGPIPFYEAYKKTTIELVSSEIEFLRGDLKKTASIVYKAFRNLKPVWNNSEVTVSLLKGTVQVKVGDYHFSILDPTPSGMELGDLYEFDPKAGDSGENAEDYANLVEELTNPGALLKTLNKTMVLYTARPKKDRDLYLLGKDLPAGIFLTSSLPHAEGLLSDMPDRDLWMVRIQRRYLYQTLATPVEYYQTISKDKFVPVISMELL